MSSGQAEIFDDLLNGRQSCRAYDPRSVPRPTIERLLVMAQRAPSWCNTQSWQTIITEGEGTERFRTVLSQYARSGAATEKPDLAIPLKYSGVYQERRRTTGRQLYSALGIAPGDRTASAEQAYRNFDLFGAPHAAIITTDREHGIYGAVDAGFYVAHFLLAAQSLGLGSIPQAALAIYAPVVRSHFAIPDDRIILMGVSFGYPDRRHPVNGYRTDRADLSQVVQWVST